MLAIAPSVTFFSRGSSFSAAAFIVSRSPVRIGLAQLRRWAASAFWPAGRGFFLLRADVGYESCAGCLLGATIFYKIA